MWLTSRLSPIQAGPAITPTFLSHTPQQAVFERVYSIASQVIALRERGGLTQADLAERTGIDQADISRIERGSANPTERTLSRIGDALGAELRFVERSQA
jgi:ribosome-binding protein aMBF1 (putative translation factor)